MRNNIVHIGADELTYEIRGIVEAGQALEGMGIPMTWENIGDPVAKGHELPQWVKEIIVSEVNTKNESFGYCPTKGLLSTREFLADMHNKEGAGPKLSADNILFFNGLGDAISHIYTYLNSTARVIGPSPAYPAHSSAEGAHSGGEHITYTLNPERNWLPDLEELRNKVEFNPTIVGILIINPGNPTGSVYPEKVLKEIVKIAEEFDLFLLSDEIYANIVFGSEKMVSLSRLAGNVPTIIMKGLSKEIPWPGARCGWIEVYNKERDSVFARYIQTLVDAKTLEVCATTLPQAVLPAIFSDERHEVYAKQRSEIYAKRADIAYDVLSGVDGIIAPKPTGAFYISVVFEDGALKEGQTLPIENSEAKTYVEDKVKDVSFDKRFTYYLMAAHGICVVPLSGLSSSVQGFRMTLLEADEETFKKTAASIAEAINIYLHS